MNIAVLFGGISPERNVSIAGGKAVIEALQGLGHNVIPVDPAYGINGVRKLEDLVITSEHPTNEELAQFSTKNLIDCINSPIFDNIDLAFIVLHGINGEDGKIQALLELRGIPYTGSDIKSSAVGIDKNLSKMLFLASGIATPRWVPIHPEDVGNFDLYHEINDELGDHIVVKPNDQGSTIGISIVDTGNLDDIHEAVLIAFEYSDLVLVERFIDGREITVGIVGGEALPVIEIIPESGFYDYKHKYSKGHTEYVCPAEMTEDIAEFTQNLALSAYQALGCSGFARVDFRLTDEGQPYIIEINTIPGFTSTSLVPMAAKEVGIEFPELCEQIINIALKINPEENETEE